jgi:hypothetical protein
VYIGCSTEIHAEQQRFTFGDVEFADVVGAPIIEGRDRDQRVAKDQLMYEEGLSFNA